MKKKVLVGLIGLIIIGSAIMIHTNYANSSSNESVEPIVIEEVSEQPIEQVDVEEVIEYRVTAYCACETCCGKWASNRPLDEFGNPIIFGASGNTLTAGVSCASTLPFGTQVELDGYGVVTVEDRVANWVVDTHGIHIIDIYFDNHQTALDFGLQHLEGVVIND